jgi:RNA polymerase sigma factor (sigma-70 family)
LYKPIPDFVRTIISIISNKILKRLSPIKHPDETSIKISDETSMAETNKPDTCLDSTSKSKEQQFQASESRILLLRSTLKREISKLQPGYLKKRLDESDVVQEVTLIACRSLHRFQGKTDTEFASWLRKMIRTRVRSLVRFNVRKKRDVRREVDHQHLVSAVNNNVQSNEFGFDESTKIHQALLALPQRNRTVIQMKLLEGMTFVEIGHKIGCTDEGARKIWARSLVQLGKLMERYDQQPPDKPTTQSG